jgi:hypothetical protein
MVLFCMGWQVLAQPHQLSEFQIHELTFSQGMLMELDHQIS